MQQTTRRERLRYAFDNFMARGTIALILGLFAASALLIVGITIVVWLFSADDYGDQTFLQALWFSLMRTLDSGTMGGDVGRMIFLAGSLAVTLSGVFIVATLIGVLSNGIQAKLDDLRKGHSRVIEHDHTVILGWSQQVFTIVSELVEANANQRRACVVVLADKDKVEMEDEIRARVPVRRTTRIVCRSGSPIDLDEIDIANVQTSRAIIILSPGGDDPDVDVIKTMLAITNDPNRRPEPYHVVAEIRDPRNVEVARMVGKDEVELVVVGDLIARITAQTCRQPGLSVVYTELLDFGGDEIYFSHQPTLTGKTFGEAILAFEDSVIIGLAPAGATPGLNPPMNTVLGPDDRLVAISADDDTVRPSGLASYPVDTGAIVDAAPRAPRPERTLVLGWNWRGPAVIRELDHYVQPGSGVTVVTTSDAAETTQRELHEGLANQAAEVVAGDTTDRGTLDGLDVASYDHVVLLSASEELDIQRADARTLVTLLHLREMAAGAAQPFSITSEMLDVRNRSLAEVTRADDFIVSDRLVSLYLTQVAENKALSAIFADIFDSEGSEIYLRAAGDYVQPGRPVSFYTVTEAARRRGEVAIGYRLRAAANDAGRSYGVVVNPRKSVPVTFGADDRIIVIAQE